MDYLKKYIGGDNSPLQQEDGATTVGKLVERVRSSTLIDDRRGAVRALKSLSKGKFRFEVGTQGIDTLVEVLEKDKTDLEIISFAVFALGNIFSEQIDEDEDPGIPADIGAQFTEIFIKDESRVTLLLSLLDEYDFQVRRPVVHLITTLLSNKLKAVQDLILVSPQGVPILMDLLSDSREVIRNDAILLMIHLTKSHTNIQKIVAFENAFERLLEIVIDEGYSDGGVVVEDCLTLLLNLLKDNKSNQTLFVEGNYVNRLSAFFHIDSLTGSELGWPAQKVANTHCMLQIVRALVSPNTPSKERIISQRKMNQSRVLEQLCTVLMASGIPADVLTECINTVAELIRGHVDNQNYFASVMAPSQPPQPAIVVLLMSMVNDKQPLVLRCAVLYCFQCFLYKNDLGQSQIISTLLPTSTQLNQITAGQLLCSGLFSNDALSTWLASVALLHTVLGKAVNKESLLRVQLATTGSQPITLLQQCMQILSQGATHTQTKLGLLMFMITWLYNSPAVVSSFLSKPDNISYLTSQVSAHDSDETELIVQGLCAFLLGLCVEFNKEDNEKFDKDKLKSIIDKRIGFDVYADRLSQVSRNEAYTTASKHPYLRARSADEIYFDHEFTQLYKSLEVKLLSTVTTSDEDKSHNVNHDSIVTHYKELIRDQDQELAQLREQLKSHTANTAELESHRTQVQQLKDQLSLLRASSASITNGLAERSASPSVSNSVTGGVSSEEYQSKVETIGQLTAELEQLRLQVKQGQGQTQSESSINQELQLRLADTNSKMENLTQENSSLNIKVGELEAKLSQSQISSQSSSQSQAELQKSKKTIETLNTQIAKLQKQVETGSAETTTLTARVAELEESATDTDDLLLLLQEKADKVKALKAELVGLGATVSEEEEEEEDED